MSESTEKGKRIFNEEELKKIPRYRPWVMRDLIEEKKLEEVKQIFLDLEESITLLHDGAFTWISGLMTYIYDRYGLDGLEEAYKSALKFERMDVLPKYPQLDFDLIVRNVAAELRGLCKQKFKMEEDDEKITISMSPCGNGGRLIDIAYDPDAGIAKCSEATPLTFNESNLPIYCSGCAMREIREFEETGLLRTVHASDAVSTPKNHDCKLYIYKDPDDIPEAYYKRLELEKPAPALFPSPKPARFFSDEQLTRLSTMPEDAFLSALESSDDSNLMQQFDTYYEEKTKMHDAVGCMCGSLLMWIADKEGLDGVSDAEKFAHGIEGEIAMPHGQESGLKSRVVGAISALHGHVHQVMSLAEDDEKIVLTVNPCGSGGRMIQRAYDPDIGYARLKGPHDAIWGLDELPVYCVHCPILEQMSIDGSGTFNFVHSFKSTEVPKSPVCEYIFYKDPDDIPEEYYTRIGRVKPKA